MIVSRRVVRIDPFQRRQHLAVPSGDTGGPDQRFEVLNFKLGLRIGTKKQVGRVRPGASAISGPCGLHTLQRTLCHGANQDT